MTPTKIFISYARVDGVDLATRLRTDLAATGHVPWLDTDRIGGGASWTAAIETALDEARVVLALLSQGSYVSEICRAEQLRALRKGKCVIPLLARRPTDVPLHLEARNYRDFSDFTVYADRFRTLLEDIDAGKGVPLKDQFRRTYVTAPPLPENFVPRPAALEALRNVVIRERTTANLPLTALIGMGGMGKTVLAQALCRDEVVQQAFPDGVVWIKAGKEAADDLVTRFREVGKGLNDDLSLYDGELGCRNQYRTAIGNKAALIVIDDVWSARDVEPFRAESPRSALLFTTRDGSIAAALGALDHPAGSLTREESRAVLSRWASMDAAGLPPEAGALIDECGRLPLALAMVGATLRRKPPVLWKRQLELLRAADLEKIKADFPDYAYAYPSLFRAIQVSVDELDAAPRERYLALAVLLQDMPAHPAVLQALWQADEGEAAETAERFIDLSLAQREPDGVSIRLHGLQLDFVRSLYADKGALALIHGAVLLASNVIARDPAQFASQMAGRLLAHDDQPAIRRFTARFRESPPRPWLRAVTATLTPPGGALLLQFKAAAPAAQPGDPDGLSAVAVSRSQIVTGEFAGKDLSVWDLETGALQRVLSGHTDRVTAAAISPDDRRALSASLDKTIRLWDLQSGQALRQIDAPACALAIAPDNRRFAAGGPDGSVSVFDVESGQVIHTLAGCSDRVDTVAFALDRYVLASAGGRILVWDLKGDPAPRVLTDVAPGTSSERLLAVLGGTGRIASAAGKTLAVWDVRTGQAAFTTSREGFPYDQLAALPDGRSVLYACLMDVLEVLDTATGNVRSKLPNTAMRVASLGVTPDGRRAVTSSNSGEIRVWDLQGRPPARVSPHHSRWVRSLAITDGGKYAVSISLDGSMMWDLENGEMVQTFDDQWSINPFRDTAMTKLPGPWNRFESLMPQAHAVAVVAGNKLQVRNLVTDEAILEFGPPEGAIQVLRATPDGTLAATGGDDGIAKVWDLREGKEVASLEGHTAAIVDLAIDAVARRVVTGSMDHTVKVWDVDGGMLRHTFDAHTAPVSAVAQVPGRDYVVSVSQDQTLRIWDAANGDAVAAFSAENALMSCAAAPDGVTIVAGEVSGGVHVLRLEGVAEAPSLAGESWSSEPNRPEFGAGAITMALQSQSNAEYEQAEQLFAVALQTRIFQLGLASPLVAQCLNYLALLYCETKQYEKAEPLFVQGLMIFDRAQGPDSLNVAINLQNLALLYTYKDEWFRAEVLYARSIAILEKNPEAAPAMLAAGLENLAEVLRRSSRDAEATAHDERAKQIRIKLET